MDDVSSSSTEDLHDEMEELVKLDGLENPAREHELGAMLQNLDGIRNVTIANGAVSITYDPTVIVAKEIHERMRQAGFTPGETKIAPAAPPVPP